MAFKAKLKGEAKKMNGTNQLNNDPLNIPTIKNGQVLDMPDSKKDIVYVVSAIVFKMLKETTSRDDFVMFDLRKTVRDDNNLIIAQGGFTNKF